VADTQLTRSVDSALEFMDDEKIKGDFEHFIVGYAGTERTFEIFRKYMVGELTLEWSTQKMLYSTNIQRAAHCLQMLNKIADKENTIKLLAVNHRPNNLHLYYIDEFGFVTRTAYQAIGTGRTVADHFCKSLSRKRTTIREFAKQAYLAIKSMEQDRPDLFVGGTPTVKYMKKDEIWDIFAPPKDMREFEQHARKFLRNADRRMKSIAAKSKRELMMHEPRS
jgi:20S proteasome alpha/beta subunit